MGDARELLKKIDREVCLLRHAQALLGWDQETYMPPRGVEERAEQLAFLQGLIHERTVSPAVARALETADAGSGTGTEDPDGPFLRAWKRRYDRAVKLPAELVVRLARATGLGQARWAEAKKSSDFSIFQPSLEEILGLTVESAGLIGYREHPYDALLDEYEPWMTTAEVDRLFTDLRDSLGPLVRSIAGARQVRDDFLYRSYPVDAQEAFGRRVLAAMGFPSERGRLDVSMHPFTTTLGSDDVRITTRYNERNIKSALFGTIHECGHALYELGFSEKIRGTILADGTSLGIHESQSRMWENMIGRGMAFWTRWYPVLKSSFPGLLDDVPLDIFYRGINKVEGSLVRVEADEVTYSLHIVLRFLLEKDLVTGALTVKDLPEAWRAMSKDILGKVPEKDADGVLQDIHWSMGAIGYFPTYALGNLYGAQFHAALLRDIPDLEDRILAGDLAGVSEWLGRKIHSAGASRTAAELALEVTGSPLDSSWFVRYLADKYSEIYEL